LDAEQRIAELEAELSAKNARIAEQDARLAEQDARIEVLVRQVAALTERLGRNSGNSNLPPSSDAPGAREDRTGKSKGKRRGGQPGHRGSRRVLLSSSILNLEVTHFRCAHALQVT
jgi:uncharacterized coiled-coil protein SlyX